MFRDIDSDLGVMRNAANLALREAKNSHLRNGKEPIYWGSLKIEAVALKREKDVKFLVQIRGADEDCPKFKKYIADYLVAHFGYSGEQIEIRTTW